MKIRDDAQISRSMDQALETRRADRNHGLDLLRGSAALSVCAYHSIHLATGATILSMGTFTVYIFFTLSATTMLMVYDATFSTDITPRNLLEFYRNRFARIMPLLVLAASLFFLISAKDTHATARAFLTGTGLYALQLPQYLSGAPGAWSLGIEILFYIVFPISAMLSQSKVGLIFATVMLIFGQQTLLSILTIDFAPETSIHSQMYTSALTFAPYFAVGAIAFRLAQLDLISKSGTNLIAGYCIFLGGAFFSLATDVDVTRSNFSQLAMIATCFGAVFLVFSANIPPNFAPLCSFLGNISYAIYLTHWFVFIALAKVLPISPLTAPLFLGFEVAAAWLVYAFYERPARDALRGAWKVRAKVT